MLASLKRTALVFACLLSSQLDASNQEDKSYRVSVSRQELEQLAISGNVGAQLQLATILCGNSCCHFVSEEDKAVGLKWLRKAAETGNPEARNRLANYLYGRSPQETQEAFSIWRAATLESNRLAIDQLSTLLFGRNYAYGPYQEDGLEQAKLEPLLAVLQEMFALHKGQKAAMEADSIFTSLGRAWQGSSTKAWEAIWVAEAEALACLQQLEQASPGIMVSGIKGLSNRDTIDGPFALYQDGLFSWGDDNVKLHRRIAQLDKSLNKAHEYRRKLDLLYKKHYNACMAVMITKALSAPEAEREAAHKKVRLFQQQYNTLWRPVQQRMVVLGTLSDDIKRHLTTYQPRRNNDFLRTYKLKGDMFPPAMFVNPAEREKGFHDLHRATQQGDVFAMHKLGMRYLHHNPDSTNGLEFLDSASEKQHLPSMIELFKYYRGKGKHRDAMVHYKRILEHEPFCAELPELSAGSAAIIADTTIVNSQEAIILSGYLHLDKDIKEAEKRFTAAQTQGSYLPELALARLYYHQAKLETVPRMQEFLVQKAFGLIVNACGYQEPSSRNPRAVAWNLRGVCLLKGQGVQQNFEGARKCFLTASEGGCAAADFNLGRMHRTKDYGCYDPTKADWYYGRAGRLMPQAWLELANFLSKELPWYNRNSDQAVLAYARAALRGVPEASYQLALIFRKENRFYAYDHALKAANLGHVPAMKLVSDALYEGRTGVTQNCPEAFLWMMRGADAGDSCQQARLREYIFRNQFAQYANQHAQQDSLTSRVTTPLLNRLEEADPLKQVKDGSFIHMVTLSLADWQDRIEWAQTDRTNMSKAAAQLDKEIWQDGFAINCIELNRARLNKIDWAPAMDLSGFLRACHIYSDYNLKGDILYIGEAAWETRNTLLGFMNETPAVMIWRQIQQEVKEAGEAILLQLTHSSTLDKAVITGYKAELTEYLKLFDTQITLQSTIRSEVDRFMKQNQSIRNRLFMTKYTYLFHDEGQ